MTAPFPLEARVRATALSQQANEIYGHFVWLARWSDEIVNDADLDLKKLAQLGLIHCRVFAALTDNPLTALHVAFEERCRREGLVWPRRQDMIADLVALRTEALSLHAFVRDNVPECRRSVIVEYDDDGAQREIAPLKLPKPHPVIAEVAKLRALFE